MSPDDSSLRFGRFLSCLSLFQSLSTLIIPFPNISRHSKQPFLSRQVDQSLHRFVSPSTLLPLYFYRNRLHTVRRKLTGKFCSRTTTRSLTTPTTPEFLLPSNKFCFSFLPCLSSSLLSLPSSLVSLKKLNLE